MKQSAAAAVDVAIPVVPSAAQVVPSGVMIVLAADQMDLSRGAGRPLMTAPGSPPASSHRSLQVVQVSHGIVLCEREPPPPYLALCGSHLGEEHTRTDAASAGIWWLPEVSILFWTVDRMMVMR